MSFNSTLYKNGSVCKMHAPGNTVTRFWVFLNTIEHIHLVPGRFLTRSPSFLDRFVKPLWPFATPFQAASTSSRLNMDFMYAGRMDSERLLNFSGQINRGQRRRDRRIYPGCLSENWPPPFFYAWFGFPIESWFEPPIYFKEVGADAKIFQKTSFRPRTYVP